MAERIMMEVWWKNAKLWMEEPWTGNIYSLSLQLQGPKILRWNWAGQGIFRFKIKWRNINSYDMNLPTGIFCRTLNGKSFYSLNLHMFMGEKSLERYNRVQSHTSGTACPHLLCLLGSAGGECHTHFLYYTLSCLWPTLSENTLGERKSANIVFLLLLLCFSVWVWVYIEQRKKKTHKCFHI